MTHAKIVVCLAALGLGVAACGSSLGPKTAHIDGMTSEQYRAAYEIAAARCDRQTSACSSYASREACMTDKFAVSVSDTRLPHCSNEVDATEVQSCVAAIEQGRCGTGIARLDACKKSALCPYESQEGTF